MNILSLLVQFLVSTYPYNVILFLVVGSLIIILQSIGSPSGEDVSPKEFDRTFLDAVPVEYVDELELPRYNPNDPLLQDVKNILNTWREVYTEYSKDKVILKRMMMKKLFDTLEQRKKEK